MHAHHLLNIFHVTLVNLAPLTLKNLNMKNSCKAFGKLGEKGNINGAAALFCCSVS